LIILDDKLIGQLTIANTRRKHRDPSAGQTISMLHENTLGRRFTYIQPNEYLIEQGDEGGSGNDLFKERLSLHLALLEWVSIQGDH